MAEGFDDLVAGIHLFDMTVQPSQRALLIAEVRLRAFRDPHRDQQAQRQREQNDQAQQRTDEQHHHDHANHRDDRGDQLRHGSAAACC